MPGLSSVSASAILSEIGSDMSRFSTPAHPPVWIIKDGLAGMALILAIASRSVESASGLAGLSKPT
jgi:hypothetical protein